MGADVVWLLRARGGAAGGRPGWFDLVCCFIVLYISRISLAWQLWHDENGGDSTRVEWWRTAGSGGSYSAGGLGCNGGFRSLCFHKYELGLGPILGPDPRSLSGLGAVLLSLLKNRTLDVLLSKGKEYVLLVDSDNVAAKIDPKILNHLVENKIDCCMEITPTSSYDSDSIGSRSQQFELAEIAQTSVRDSMERFKLVDTGSLWVNVKALKRLLDTDEIKIEDISVSKETESDLVLLQESAVGSPIRVFITL
ncbi:UTP--glucose-1-phosphate uridylyltransferase-like isoform X2 [Argentina anserina]|uniref:UTP--glucose-1-phosphate uridylyltransferase-like isoform X2 n=1 Tax=Argentina anserina TaxID=57926 RepID=UPI002176922B|nr:UTP--glucose-1-phosphate uridylyltransferase-like isoform X2 [Potentilla anserina]